MERVQQLEASEARVRDLEADALMRSMEQPLEGEASFSSNSSREPYDHVDRDWVRSALSFAEMTFTHHIGLSEKPREQGKAA